MSGATTVEREDPPAVVDDNENRTMATVHNEPPLTFSSYQATRAQNSLFGASMSILPAVVPWQPSSPAHQALESL